MKKIIIPIILLVVLTMSVSTDSCSSASEKKNSSETVNKRTNIIDTESIKANNAWRILRKEFDKPSNTMKQYELKLTEMCDLKNYYDYCYYLQPKFNSLLKTFLHDERTFYYNFKSRPPEWYVSTSQDNKVRMYSFDNDGGTARWGKTFIQYVDSLGDVQVKELNYLVSANDVLIPPIFKRISKTRKGYTLYGGIFAGDRYYSAVVLLEDTFFTYGIKTDLMDDKISIIYKNPINGYKVRTKLKGNNDDIFVISANLSFTKNGKTYTLHTTCFGDTLFCKRRLDYDKETPQLFKKNHNETIYANYHENRKHGDVFPIYSPFFFQDMDFDGIPKLVIVHHSMGVRFHNGLDVYHIVDGTPVRVDYTPFNKCRANCGFAMTDYPQLDYKHKTITCPYQEGELERTGQKNLCRQSEEEGHSNRCWQEALLQSLRARQGSKILIGRLLFLCH